MKRVLLLAVLCNLFAFASAQERDGSVLSNYHLTTSSMLNPAFTVDSKTYMHLNLIGVNVGMYNNLMQLTNVSVPTLIRSAGALPTYETIKNTNKKYLYAAVVADAPSFYISKGRMGAGIFIRGRSVADVRKVPYQITDLIVGLTDLETIESLEIKAKNSKIANMTWVEYGGNFGYMIKHRAYDIISIGGDLKYITGINLQYAILKNLEASYVPSVSIVADMSGVYRSSTFAWRAGSGFGADFGITFKRTYKQVDSYKAHTQKSVSKCRPIEYQFKLGASLRDIGFIGFKKGTSIMQMQGSGTIDNDENIQEELDSKFSVSTITDKKIRASLPLALNLHGDYNFGYHVYAGAILQKALTPNSVTGVMASDYLTFVPRYETKNLEVAVPVSLKRYTQPQVGVGLRFRSLLIGVDNILPFIKSSNLKAVGVYFNLGWSLFKNPKCNFGTKKIDDCSKYKNGKSKIKFKSSLLRAQPIKEKATKKKKSRKPKLKLRLFKRH